MKIKNNLMYLLLIISFLYSCKSALEDLELNTPQRYTVSCFLSPQDTISLFLGLSYPVNKVIDIEENHRKIGNAKVAIFNEKGDKFSLLYNLDNRTFYDAAHQLKIENEKIYNLEIIVEDGNRIGAKCTIPKPIPDFKVLTDSSNGLFYVKYTWRDIAKEKNYYRYVGRKENKQFKQEHDLIWSDGSQLETQLAIDDDNNDGKMLNSNRSDTQKNETGGFSSTASGTYVHAILLHIDHNYYQFQQSLEKTKRGNNFEPTPTFTNIEGGLGIFAGCDTKKKTIKIR